MENKQPIILKTYKGDENSARRAFENDAIKMQMEGYYPISQNYTQGSWGCGSFLIALLLVFVLIGIIVFIYMLIVNPEGSLSVTYEFRENEEEKKCPMCAEKVKYEAIICKHCGHKFDPNIETKKNQVRFSNEIKDTQTIGNTEGFAEAEKKIRKKNNRLIIIGAIFIFFVVSIYIGKNRDNDVGNSKSSGTTIVDYEKTFDNSWRSPKGSEFAVIGKLMVKNNITVCGEYYVRIIEKNEYAIACTPDGTNWTYFVAWPEDEKIDLANAEYAMDKNLIPPR